MATKDELRQRVQAMRENLSQTMDGMDYCLDWKPTDGEWSAREVLYHLVDTPPGGIHAAARAVLQGDISELTLPPDVTDTSGDKGAGRHGANHVGDRSGVDRVRGGHCRRQRHRLGEVAICPLASPRHEPKHAP